MRLFHPLRAAVLAVTFVVMTSSVGAQTVDQLFDDTQIQDLHLQLSQRDYTPTFTVGQMNKDIDLILGEGARLQVPLTQTAATRQLMSAAQAQGDGALDYAAIIRVVQRAAGLDTD